MFDPWTATEESMEADEQASDTCAAARLRYHQFSYACSIKELRPKVEGGDGPALLECLSLLLTGQLIAPPWLELAFSNAYCSVRGGGFLSWDDVFGTPHPKGTNRKRLDRMRSEATNFRRVGAFIQGELRRQPRKTLTQLYTEAAGRFPWVNQAKIPGYYKRYMRSIVVNIELTEYQRKRMFGPKAN